MSEAPQEVPCESTRRQGRLERSRSDAELLAAAAIPRRRVILGTLRDLGTLPMSDLATHVVAREEGIPTGEVAGTARDRALTTLHHSHVPKLADTGLVTYEHTEEEPLVGPAIWLPDDPVFDAIESAFSTGRTDEVVGTLLADPLRECVVSLLRDCGRPVALEDLAEAISTAEGGPDTSTVVSLHHVHLPKLDGVGVVEYDAAERTVEFEAVPDIYDAVAGERPIDVATPDAGE